MNAVHVSGLRISFGGATPVAGVSLSVAPGECLAIVGESGAGKSLTARALLGLIPEGARMTADALSVDGVDALAPRRARLAQGSAARASRSSPRTPSSPSIRCAAWGRRSPSRS